MFSQHEIGNYSKFRKGKIRNFAVTPVAIVPRARIHYFKIYFKNIIPLSCTFISFLPSLSMEILLVKNTPPSP